MRTLIFIGCLCLHSLASAQESKSSTPDIFGSHTWYKPVVKTVAQSRVRQNTTSPISRLARPNFEYVGTYMQGDDQVVFFLTKEDIVYDVKEGDLIDNTYEVGVVLNGQLTVTHLRNDTTQLINVSREPRNAR